MINYRTTPAWPAQVKALTGGEGVDLAINTVGGDLLEQSLQAIRHGGFVGFVPTMTWPRSAS
ncbi:zinc-binding dehydrogenase [uncultured Hymenobacter sp.]|uniref:zinc-binding dehydrogenase n=1 Tax=uncultured Hymenobacter sp. TaxID=170016 RepID=UPI0035CB62C3